ncbi:hypothetical protein BKA70DRAFT_1325093 [Coprinopsis sp. MPI-PUGE-AT-0042]|nr:hypothetical protein BKA70DRAFT_1325093 [Coprinopsis sp. MPI-PUGE-AT-0042]
MHGNPKRKGSSSFEQDVTTKRTRWEAEIAPPPSECSPTASGSALITGVQSAHIFGGTFTVAGPGSAHSIVNNYHYGSPAAHVNVLEILASLPLPNFRNIQQDTHAKATKGTCVWFTTGEKFHLWIVRGKILWVNGIPGAGKTILASIVVHYLEQREEALGGTICIAYVYLRYSEPLTVREILESLVKQLVERHIDLVPVIEGDGCARSIR